jgi:hypothetical protein
MKNLYQLRGTWRIYLATHSRCLLNEMITFQNLGLIGIAEMEHYLAGDHMAPVVLPLVAALPLLTMVHRLGEMAT